MVRNFKHSSGVQNINYHIVWCSKYRKKTLVGNITFDCDAIIRETLEEVKGKVGAIEIMPDHVHLFVSIHSKISPHSLVKKLKGATSNALRKKYPQLLKSPSMWTSSYYIGTVGTISDSVVRLYIENQKGK